MDFYRQCWTDPSPSRNHQGYIRTSTRSRGYQLTGERFGHRISYAVHYGEAPPLLRHTCDNVECYNPTHLIPGTHRENMEDKIRRGRAAGPPVLNLGMPPISDKKAYQRERMRRIRAGTWIRRANTTQGQWGQRLNENMPSAESDRLAYDRERFTRIRNGTWNFKED